MAKLYEYRVTYVFSTTRGITPRYPEGFTADVIIDATDAGHALSEVLDEYGHQTIVVSIVRGDERPYGTE